MTRLDDLELRATHQEAALLDLVERLALLERAIAFEVAQREAMEVVILRLSGLPCRMDSIELRLNIEVTK